MVKVIYSPKPKPILDIAHIEHLLPTKRRGKKGPEPGLGCKEILQQRHLLEEYENGEMSSWSWPNKEPNTKEVTQLIAIMLEIAIKFFFENFIYTYGGENFRQSSGGPIGARLTMCIARLVMQDWWEKFEQILKDSSLEQFLNAIYVDDGRLIVQLLKRGYRFNKDSTKSIQLY